MEYLHQYSSKYGIDKLIEFGVCVQEVSVCEDGSGRLAVLAKRQGAAAAERLVFDSVLNCSGHHQVPIYPSIDGMDKFEGESFHSTEYKSSDRLKGKRVLIVGTGESALDISYQAIQVSDDVSLSIRNGFLSVPHLIGSVPLDTMITNVFESCYLHPLVETLHLRWIVSTIFIRLGFLLATGTSGGYNQWVGCVSPTRRGYHILNKSVRAMPYINHAHKRKSRVGWLYRWLDDPTGGKEIKTVSEVVCCVGSKRLRFKDGSEAEFDVVIFATGYTRTTNDHNDDNTTIATPTHATARHNTSLSHTQQHSSTHALRILLGRYKPDPTLYKLPKPTIHNIIHPSVPNFAHIGLVRPNVGAIPPMAEMQVRNRT